jgi:amino acid transporter
MDNELSSPEEKGLSGRALILNDEMSEITTNKIESDDIEPHKPKRKLSLMDGIAIIVGIIIGSGIFSSPGLALERCGSPGLVLIAWTVSGVLVILLAQCYLELGAMMPSAGGDFDYLKRAYGERVAFSFAWYNFFVGKTGAQAIIATIFGRYFEAVIKGDTHALQDGSNSDESVVAKLSAVCLITFITLLNCTGIKESATLSIILTATKVLLVVMVFVFSVAYESSGPQFSAVARHNLSPDTAFDDSRSLAHFGSAMVACLWCFDGFADANFLMEELRHPVRDLPRIVKCALVVVTCCYLLINVGYLSVLSREDIIDSKAIAVDFGATVSQMFKGDRNVLPIMLALGAL